MSRVDMFKNAYLEIIKPGKIKLDMIGVNIGISYTVKDYFTRIFNKEPFRYLQCGCRGAILQPSVLCKHHIATVVEEFLRQNKLILIDPEDPRLKIKTAFELDGGIKKEED